MKGFSQIIQDCPEAVRDYVSQMIVVNEYSRIYREMDSFVTTLISLGYDPTVCQRARKIFATVCDGFDRSEKAA